MSGKPDDEDAPVDAGARVAALEADNERLRELASAASRLAEFGRFAAEQNHELRQPLLAIKGLAQLLLDNDSFTAAEVHESARLIVEQSDRMARLVSELRHTAVPRGGGGQGRVEIPRLLTRAVSLLEYRFRGHAEVVLDVAADVPAVTASSDQVEQVIINLLANALDAVRRVEGAVIQVRARRVEAGGRALAEVCVADNGSGIAPATRARLFEAFFTTKGADVGTGLGLALSREIARGAGGELTLADDAGAWPRPAVTVFRLTLPAAD